MGIFKKKEAENEETKKEEKGENEEERTVKVKKIKDLNSLNKKRRKEPIRAWNRFDRIILLIIILITCGWSLYFALSSRGWKLPDLPRISVPKINLFGNKTVVLESNSEEKKKAESITSEFKSITGDLTGIYGLYVIDLESGYSFWINQDKKFQAASLIKLPVMVGMYMAEQNGSLNLSTSYKLRAEDKVKGSGSLHNKPVGYEISYRDLIKLMGKESDNTAFNTCRKYLGDEKIQKIINQIGMKGTDLGTNITTPSDVGLFFNKLWRAEIINKENSDELLEFITDTIYENWLAAGVPGDVRVAHKYGREIGVVNDAGVVFGKDPSGSDDPPGRRPYVIVILSEGVIDKEADKFIPDMSKMIYEKMTSFF